MSQVGVTAVLGAMESEVRGLVSQLEVVESGRAAGCDYWLGELAGRQVVVSRCGMGKVAAAAGVQWVIDRWQPREVVVCGLAGGLAAHVAVGDIVIGESFVQHDLDATPIFPRFEVPGLGIVQFNADLALTQAAYAAAVRVTVDFAGQGVTPRVRRGLIATGDQFVAGDAREAILADFPSALAVEMEGAAVAQVCHRNDVPCAVVRIVSDSADGQAPADFAAFARDHAARYSVAIILELLLELA